VRAWSTKGVTGTYGVSLWKHIRRGWDIFYIFTSVEVGDGSCTRFSHDIWCGDCPLKESFPELFCLARNRDTMVANLGVLAIIRFIGTLTSVGWCMIGRWTLPFLQ
jgi:hypothetical protein